MHRFETYVKLQLFDYTSCRYPSLTMTKLTLCDPFCQSRSHMYTCTLTATSAFSHVTRLHTRVVKRSILGCFYFHPCPRHLVCPRTARDRREPANDSLAAGTNYQSPIKHETQTGGGRGGGRGREIESRKIKSHQITSWNSRQHHDPLIMTTCCYRFLGPCF